MAVNLIYPVFTSCVDTLTINGQFGSHPSTLLRTLLITLLPRYSCLGENESQCPNCARTHGVVREIRKNNEQLAGRHDLFLSEVAESEDSFATVASAYGRGWMALANASS